MVTSYEWTRRDPVIVGPHLPNVWSAPLGGGVPGPALPGGWTLRRTIFESYVAVQVAPGTTLTPDWWINSEVRIGLKFAPDGVDPGMARNDQSAEVLAIQQLLPAFYGDPSGTSQQSAVFRQAQPLDIRTARKDDGLGNGVLYYYLWATDAAGVFLTGSPPISIQWTTQANVLWSQ